MIQKRVLIGSFIFIIAGLFFIVSTDSGITGAAVGISTSALDSVSNPLFGFFLIWIACFMLIANTTTLEKIIKSEGKAQKFARKDQVYETFQDYDTKVKSYLKGDGTPKKPSDLNLEETAKVVESVEQGRRKRCFKEFLGQETFNLYESGDNTFKARYEMMYDAHTGLDKEKRLGIYSKTFEEGGEGIEAEVKITKHELAGIAQTEKQIAFNQITPQNIGSIVGQINQELNANYDPEFYKQNMAKLEGIYDKYKREKAMKKQRQQTEQGDRLPPSN